MFGCNSIKEVYFSTATNRRLSGVSWSIIAPPFYTWRFIGDELRPWIGKPPVAVPAFKPLVPTTKDRMAVEAKYTRMQDAQRHPYLEGERIIPASLTSERFSGRVRIDVRGNATFPHFDTDGLCGYEIKNRGFTGFSAGGSKGLWLSNEKPDDNRLILCESAIDALSYAVLFPEERARYGSVGGKPNPVQPELTRAAAARMPADSEIVAAMDADEDGGQVGRCRAPGR